MKQSISDKYNVAWFKLAECVARGEKERAMGVYRLLAHSIADKAYALQLEGDLLASFNDQSSSQRYQAAMVLYHDQGRIQEAAALSEYLYSTQPQNVDCIINLISLYKHLNKGVRIIELVVDLLNVYITAQRHQEMEALLHDYAQYVQHPKVLVKLISLFKRCIALTTMSDTLSIVFLRTIVGAATDQESNNLLQHFLQDLELLYPRYYLMALDLSTK